MNPLAILSIDECLSSYFDTEIMARSRDQICMSLHVDTGILKDWATAFNQWLTISGQETKQLSEWSKHFFLWIRKQDLRKNPKKLYEYEQRNDEPKSGLNADYKRELGKRMAGN